MANILPLYLKNIILCFYKEQKESVKNLPIKEAILEVNHWCHEKVTYRPSDGRTSVLYAMLILPPSIMKISFEALKWNGIWNEGLGGNSHSCS